MPKFKLGFLSVWRYTALSLALLVLVNRQHFPTQFLKGGWGEMAGSISQALGRVSGSTVVNLLVLLVFWGALGLICYWVVLKIANILIKYRNELTIERHFTNQGRVAMRRMQWLQRLGAWAALIVACWLSLVLFGVLSALFASGLNSWPQVGWIALISSTLFLAANLYGLHILLKLAVSKSW